MPELPEVETMAGKLHDWSAGQRIDAVKVMRNPGGRYDLEHITDRTISNVFRRGKKIIFELSGDMFMVCHNAMTGFWNASDDSWTICVIGRHRRQWGFVRKDRWVLWREYLNFWGADPFDDPELQ